MARLNALIENRARQALDVLARESQIKAAFLFGSQVDGTADRWSDIDLAVFIEGLEKWDFAQRVQAFVQVQKEAGDDVEVHFFPAELLRERDPAGFAAWVIDHGVELQP